MFGKDWSRTESGRGRSYCQERGVEEFHQRGLRPRERARLVKALHSGRNERIQYRYHSERAGGISRV